MLPIMMMTDIKTKLKMMIDTKAKLYWRSQLSRFKASKYKNAAPMEVKKEEHIKSVMVMVVVNKLTMKMVDWVGCQKDGFVCPSQIILCSGTLPLAHTTPVATTLMPGPIPDQHNYLMLLSLVSVFCFLCSDFFGFSAKFMAFNWDTHGASLAILPIDAQGQQNKQIIKTYENKK